MTFGYIYLGGTNYGLEKVKNAIQFVTGKRSADGSSVSLNVNLVSNDDGSPLDVVKVCLTDEEGDPIYLKVDPITGALLVKTE